MKLHKDALCCFKQILDTASLKTVFVSPLIPPYTNIPSKTTKKDEIISNVFPWTPTHGPNSVGSPAKIYFICSVRILGACRLENLSRAMVNRIG